MMHDDELHSLAQEVLSLLEQTDNHLVCAESCTAGLVSATLAGIPGASRRLCGSAVVYRDELKANWLGVPREILADRHRGDVCPETAEALARGVLAITPSASVSVSVTGHLGPDAPEGLDGVVYIGWDQRAASDPPGRAEKSQLQEPAPSGLDDVPRRIARQREAAQRVLLRVRDELRNILSKR